MTEEPESWGLPADPLEIIRMIGPTGERGMLTLQMLLLEAGYTFPGEGKPITQDLSQPEEEA